MNCGEAEVSLPKGFTMGHCEPIALENVHNIHSDIDTDDEEVLHSETKSDETTVHSNVRCLSEKTTENGKQPTVPSHLTDLFDRSSALLSEHENDQLSKLLRKHQQVFSTSKTDLGKTNLVKHKINTGNAAPIKQAPRRQPIERRSIEREEIENMLERNIIEPSSSPWASPVVLIKKKSGDWRFCIDYRRINALTVTDAYPIPNINDSLDSLSGANYFCTMDLCSGYWQVEMDEEDKLKTAFSSRTGLYHFNTMPFGLVNAPATFERLMETVLRGLQWEECLVYIDDIICFGTTVEMCLTRLEHIFDRLQNAGLKLRSDKCHFFQKEVLFLGHIVSNNGISTDPSKIDAVKEWPTPVNTKQVRGFLGLAGYYRRFVRQFSEIAGPLHKLTEKSTTFKWTPECQTAFDELKDKLTSSPILSYPQAEGQYILDTDASDKALGAVLSQMQDGKEKVIAYMSTSLSRAEQRYWVLPSCKLFMS